MTLAESFGKKVKERREEMGLSMERLCFSTGVSKPTLISIERGEGGTRLETALKIGEDLDLTIVSADGQSMGEAIRAARKKAKIKMDDLAEKGIVSKPTLVALERGETGVRLDTLEKVARVTGVSLIVSTTDGRMSLNEIRGAGLNVVSPESSGRVGPKRGMNR